MKTSHRASMLSVLTGFVRNEEEEIKERTHRDYGDRIRTYRLQRSGDFKRIT